MGECLLKMKNISKAFPGVQALDDVSFDLDQGEVHALIGENGAGKSTLIKILSGVYTPDSGQISLNGEQIHISDPKSALNYGISCIHQEMNFIPVLTVSENIFLGHRLPVKLGRNINWRELNRRSGKLLQVIGGSHINPAFQMKNLSPADTQLVMIAHALSQKAKIIIMDEPTSSLASREIERLFQLIRQLKESGVSFVYITHRLDEALVLSDRITVLRNGGLVETLRTIDANKEQLIAAMIGKTVEEKFRKRKRTIGAEEILKVEDLYGGPLQPVSFSVRRGEIFGIIGLVGSGRTELARMLFAADPKEGGKIFLEGREIADFSTNRMIQRGICLAPEDRKSQGLILRYDIQTNLTYPTLVRYRNRLTRKLNRHQIRVDAEKAVKSLSIKATGVSQKTEDLSGGNQQKVVIAKWLNASAKIIILDEPTKGIDVGAKTELYQLLEDLSDQGKGIIFISSEIQEILGICDRVLILHEGKRIGVEDVPGLSQDSLLRKMFGENDHG